MYVTPIFHALLLKLLTSFSKSIIRINYIQGSEKNCKISSQLKHATLPFMGHKLDHLAISDDQPAQEGLQPCQCIPERNINQHNFLGTTKSIKRH
jgi:hypothetical protein